MSLLVSVAASVIWISQASEGGGRLCKPDGCRQYLRPRMAFDEDADTRGERGVTDALPRRPIERWRPDQGRSSRPS